MPDSTNARTSEAPQNEALDKLHAEARDIFAYALEHCNIGEAFDRHLHFEGSVLVHHPYPGLQNVLPPVRIDLNTFRNIRIIALGKAAVPMLDALITRLPRRRSYRAICAGPQRLTNRNWRIRSFAAGHPQPNQESFQAARAALHMLHSAGEDTFVFFLISGGGSAMLELPLDRSIPLDDTIAFHEALINSGATIQEMNIVRKHFSAVKGGRLALAAPKATKLTLQIADVPLHSLEALASGPTIPDRSTISDCHEILSRYHLMEQFPPSVRAFFSRTPLEETPGAKLPGLPTFTSALRSVLRPRRRPEVMQPPGFGSLYLDTLLSGHDLVNAARDRAQQLGYKVVIDNACDNWDYAAASGYLLQRAAELRKQHPRLCLISGGEVTVRLNSTRDGKAGVGGRNQHFALAAAIAIARRSTRPLGSAGKDDICVLSAGSDGIDGNSPAAGSIADPTTTSRAASLNFNAVASLQSFDSCPLFSALGDTIVTGRTGHNLRDLRLFLCSTSSN